MLSRARFHLTCNAYVLGCACDAHFVYEAACDAQLMFSTVRSSSFPIHTCDVRLMFWAAQGGR